MISEIRTSNEAQLDELGSDPGQVGSDSAGQSGDTQGPSKIGDSADESVEGLADTEQAYCFSDFMWSANGAHSPYIFMSWRRHPTS